ncbi:unnamed protein product [Zymoseptoria tritici ST99CH_1A5]|uniref:Phosphoinositide phospholipase C n=3 Tax=Zymoseptoria tritici TaxID=1047171 RepID=A0A1X7RES9_ZYMT9|nr:unnamed protein product [Zymoseptoria tritici ST99CH_3D7]SMR42277.1 unnamed protein product [Zymoseptoria tritici ST99CH_1E4]SMR44450.1 unnamed protein product [Zymoseptoria tritici ST99CH_3D1]SMY19605.1 unnamed protein product [Zymoseptoria tritici ST99CH_1A5]
MADKTKTPVLSQAIIKYAKLASGEHPKADFDEYLKHLADPASSAPLPIKSDTSHPLSHYFISSSHNTYLSGNQLWSKSSADAYKDVLKRGCRCVEIDLWDGDSPSSSEAEDDGKPEDREVGKLAGMLKQKLGRLRGRSKADKKAPEESPVTEDAMPAPWRASSGRSEPVVYHGYTATKEMPFRKVCEVVRDYAFRTSDLPVIVSLEVHCSIPQQEIVVELMNDYWGAYLVRRPDDFSDSTPLPALESLKKKILVKVKYSPPEKAKKTEASKSGADSSSEDDSEAVKKGKILPALSSMGVFTRAFHFSNFEQPEAKIPTHVFSLSESKLLDACEEHQEKVLDHNRHYLMRAYPKGTRLSSSNLDPTPFWRVGLQMVALNFQKMNAAMMLNTAQFDGSGGWVLKPAGYLPTEKQSRPDRVELDLSIKLLAAQNLGLEGDTPNVYVKCELHVESQDEIEQHRIPKAGENKGGERKLRSATHHSREPDFNDEALEFKRVQHVFPPLSFVRIKVMDDTTYQTDKLLGWACYRLDRLPQGLLLVHLRGEDSKPTTGMLLLSVQSNLKVP